MIKLAVYVPAAELSIILPGEIVGSAEDPAESSPLPDAAISVYLPQQIMLHPEELIEVVNLPLLPASQIGSGVLDPDRIPQISSDKILWDAEDAGLLDQQEAEADNSIVIGQPLYLKQNGHADLASAAAIGTARVCGLAVSNAVAATSVSYSPDGVIELANWTLITESVTLTPGAVYFLSTNPGKLTPTAPTASGQVVIAVGNALSSTKLAIELQSPILL